MDVPTSAVTFVETEHGRLRRRQRGIDKKDLQAAKKYGTKSGTHPRHNGDRTSMYEHKDIVYIVNEVTGEEVTSYAKPLKLDPVPVDATLRKQHETAKSRIRENLDSWTSNTVIVVDTSGSMKTADVWGTRTRLGAVWVSIALDFLAHRLENGDASPTDVVSIVSLSLSSTVVIREAPCTWILYNTLVEIYNDSLVEASGHGPFLPCLSCAEELLQRNSNASCAMALIFLSDGAPSDFMLSKGATKDEWRCIISERVERLAEKFGRRLTFTAIGIGDYESFETLEKMVEAAKDYGAIAEFRRPSMTSASLGSVFTSVATSITTTQLEMTDLSTMKQRKVRDFVRESRTKASESIVRVSSDDFWIYPLNLVRRRVYREWFEGKKIQHVFEETTMQHPDARYVAMAKRPFGEGAERFAFRFFEIAADQKTILGPALVAKESRLILEDEGSAVGDERARKKFVRTFCSTQQLARRLAQEFNDKMDRTRRIHRDTPRVTFLDCSIYEIKDKNLGKLSVLVEQKLDHTKWHKWNSNNGYVEGMERAPKCACAEEKRDELVKVQSLDLGAIDEGSEDENASTDEEDEATHRVIQPVLFSASDVAQAFSHFTYQTSKRKRLVCDLQGVFDERANVMRFSDPVIHYYNLNRSDRRCVHGRTDRGVKGFRMFFETHNNGYHGHLCRLVLRGFRRPMVHHHNNTNAAIHNNTAL